MCSTTESRSRSVNDERVTDNGGVLYAHFFPTLNISFEMCECVFEQCSLVH